jgi:hypothetical protein
MRMRLFPILPTLFLLIGLAPAGHAKSYWEGNQLNNQSRLGQPFNGFETEDPEQKKDKITAGYGAQVHGERFHKGTANDHSTLIDLSGDGVDQFLSVSRLEDGGRRFTIKLQVLFEENTAEYKPGSITLLDRLNLLLQSTGDEHIRLVFVDDAGNAPGVEELHIERTSTVLAYLAMLS